MLGVTATMRKTYIPEKYWDIMQLRLMHLTVCHINECLRNHYRNSILHTVNNWLNQMVK